MLVVPSMISAMTLMNRLETTVLVGVLEIYQPMAIELIPCSDQRLTYFQYNHLSHSSSLLWKRRIFLVAGCVV